MVGHLRRWPCDPDGGTKHNSRSRFDVCAPDVGLAWFGDVPATVVGCAVLSSPTPHRRRWRNSRRGSHLEFVLSWRVKKGQYEPALSSLGVLLESAIWPSSR